MSRGAGPRIFAPPEEGGVLETSAQLHGAMVGGLRQERAVTLSGESWSLDPIEHRINTISVLRMVNAWDAGGAHRTGRGDARSPTVAPYRHELTEVLGWTPPPRYRKSRPQLRIWLYEKCTET
ncbi:hypothetical protein Misp02_62490 [Microtetraspora sp. NBRC 16547]|nr:hypothetical protein Misp02_62490 [Microtetraspora sp. NBRC 16547]